MRKITERERAIAEIEWDKNLSYGYASIIYDEDIIKKRAKEIKDGTLKHCRNVGKTLDWWVKLISVLCGMRFKQEKIIMTIPEFLKLPIYVQCLPCRRVALRREQGLF